jgi:hypothetical protein
MTIFSMLIYSITLFVFGFQFTLKMKTFLSFEAILQLNG